ncbi:MAG: UMP kinase [Candidatus Aenigmatarchaeota archaeon]
MKTVVISLGGSLIVPDEIDIGFLENFRKVILSHRDTRFIIVTGGGKTCRKYIQAAKELGISNQEALDWIGIAATNMNEMFVKEIFANVVKSVKLSKNHEKRLIGWNMLIGSGIAPGHSTDMDAVLLAKTYKADAVVNLTDIDYVYSADPKKDRNAKPLKKLTWSEYKNCIGGKWTPGLHTPFDPVASRLAEKNKLKVVILNAKNIDNFNAFLKEKDFIGSVIG